MLDFQSSVIFALIAAFLAAGAFLDYYLTFGE